MLIPVIIQNLTYARSHKKLILLVNLWSIVKKNAYDWLDLVSWRALWEIWNKAQNIPNNLPRICVKSWKYLTIIKTIYMIFWSSQTFQSLRFSKAIETRLSTIFFTVIGLKIVNVWCIKRLFCHFKYILRIFMRTFRLFTQNKYYCY